MIRLNRPLTVFLAAAALGGGLGALLSGCPSTGVTCSAALSPCGTGCADFQNDRFNCGGCGTSCEQGQVCVSAQCQCQPGSVLCGSQCAVLQTDPRNCGACGTGCPAGQFCQTLNGVTSCSNACSGTMTACGQSCVDLTSDINNCGTCGNACPQAQSCHASRCTYDLIAACFTVGEVVGLQSGPDLLGPHVNFGSQPGPLASVGGTVLLSADQMNQVLDEGRIPDFSMFGEAPAIGAAPNDILVDGQFVYVVNSLDNTLQILQMNGVVSPPDAGAMDAGSSDAGVSDAGSPMDGGFDAGPTVDAGPPPDSGAPNDAGGGPLLDGGLGLVTIAELNLGTDTSPEWMAQIGSQLYITLYGGFGAAASAGQKIVQVDVTNRFAPFIRNTFDLSMLPLSPFDGGTAIARPQGIIARDGLLYAALNNLDPNYAVAGPGMLAKLDPSTDAGIITAVDIGNGCLNAINLISDGTNLFVVCAGSVTYDATFTAIANAGAGLALLAPADAGWTLASSWLVHCPPGDAGCAVPLPMNLAEVGNRLYVGDANAGRIFAVDNVNNQLTERRGYAPIDGGPPISACPFQGSTQTTNVGSLLTP